MNAIHHRWKFLGLLLIGCILLSCKTELYHNLQEQEANEMLAILLEEDIKAEKFTVKGDIFGIYVEEKQFAQAMTLLKNHGYPRPQFEGVGNIFKNQSRISSSLEQRARLNYALTQELAETLSAIDGILTARVHASIPEESLDRKQKEQNSAAVFIRYDDHYDIHDLTPRIKNLVSRSLAHVDYKDIAVVLIPAERLVFSMKKKSSISPASTDTIWKRMEASPQITLLAVLLVILLLSLAIYKMQRPKAHDGTKTE